MVSEHPKYYNSKGEEVPSVTTVLKLLNTNLDGWHNYMGFKRINTTIYVAEAAYRGSLIHDMFDRLCKGKIDPNNYVPSTEEIDILNDVGIDVYIDRMVYLLNHFSENGYNIYSNEMKITGELFGGTLDLLMYNEKEDRYVLLDLKTSKGVYNKMWIQLAGYTKLLKDIHNIEIDACGIILINKDVEDKKFLNLKLAKDNAYNIDIFNHLVSIYHLMSKGDLKSLGINSLI